MLRKTVLYLLLAAGAAVFSVPFAWMAATSVKVDRELFAEDLRLLPMTPLPRQTSPYIDTGYYGRLEGPHQDVLVSAFADLARRTGFRLPADMDAGLAYRHIGRGLYDKMRRSLPKGAWDGDADGILAAAAREISPAQTERVFDNVARRLSFSQIRVRSEDLEVQELGAGLPFDRRLENRTPGVVTLKEQTEKTLTYASLNYDFSKGDRILLSGTFDLAFDAADLQRIQLYLRPDDSWHELRLYVEKRGVRYAAERPLILANFGWATATWQEPGPDDQSTKIKTWILLHEAERSPDILDHPRKLKLTFEIRRSGLLRAWGNKFRLNYLRVLDYIPFWRYVRTSLFLVFANIGLTLLSCSLVAFAFARLRWPGRDFCFVLMLATMMIPPQVTMIPHFLIWKTLGAYDTLFPLWIGHAFGNAFFVFLLRQFMKGIPRDLEDAGRIDGCGFLRIYWHIILPLIKPSLATIAIFTFMATWNDFMGPLIYVADQRLYPLAFGLYAFAVQVVNNPALTMAAGLLMTLPVILLFFFAQRYFIQGTTLTGMKG
jgi:multiple sugar transport system permease protein